MTVAAKLNGGPVPVKYALLVDANSNLRELIGSVLNPRLWTIRNAKGNSAAFAMVQTRSFDLIITSAETSGKEDIALLRQIRSVRPHTRLIILAELSTPSDVIASMREHAFSYFSMPFSREKLADMIRIATEGPCWDDGIEVLSATPELIHILARSDLKTADRLVQFLDEISELPDQEKHQVGIAFREVLLNAIEYGAKLDPREFVEIEYVRAQHMVSCRIRDPGPGFMLDDIPHSATANPEDDLLRHAAVREAEGRRPGGYGVLMTRKLVDQLIYGEDGNEVLLIKYLDLDLPNSA